ncbi:hypothetical protein ACTXT7_002423 [Hymenolepis weldensis]
MTHHPLIHSAHNNDAVLQIPHVHRNLRAFGTVHSSTTRIRTRDVAPVARPVGRGLCVLGYDEDESCFVPDFRLISSTFCGWWKRCVFHQLNRLKSDKCISTS